MRRNLPNKAELWFAEEGSDFMSFFLEIDGFHRPEVA